jgi:uncharacterized protein
LQRASPPSGYSGAVINDLFRISTDRVTLTWNIARAADDTAPAGPGNEPGRLAIRALRPGAMFGPDSCRAGVPAAAVHNTEIEVGPLLYEEMDYAIYAESRSQSLVRLEHRDPNVLQNLRPQRDGQVIYGIINFRSQVGISQFVVKVDGKPEFSFEVEIFPTKLDYRRDYERLLADVQDILASIVIEYLRSTFRLGSVRPTHESTHVEWLTLLRYLVDRLEQALNKIAQQPRWSLIRSPQTVRVEQIRRPDAALRRAITRGAGTGTATASDLGIPLRRLHTERRARQTLDTAEHRWLAAQLKRIRQRLAMLRQGEARREASPRRERAIQEIEALETRIGRLLKLEPIAEAKGLPIAGFASLQLLSEPGYREAYQACLMLSLGLNLSGGPVDLSVKDLGLLYEYWCFLTTLRLVSEQLRCPIPAKHLLKTEQQGLHLKLQKGRESIVPFEVDGNQVATVKYNPLFQGNLFLVPQQPDILLILHRSGWPEITLILDAKYRLDASPEYVHSYGTPGPPSDALNTLHRYRDAILEQPKAAAASGLPKRTVLQAAAIFPYRDAGQAIFGNGRHWRALERLGVGAIPLLPDSTDYLEKWLCTAMQQGGWDLTDRAIPYSTMERAADWRKAASEPVLLAVLRDKNEAQHLQWIIDTREYYRPLTKHQDRQFAAKQIAIYSPTAIQSPGAVTHVAPVTSIEVVERREIGTPWPARRDLSELQVVYRLADVLHVAIPIINTGAGGKGARVSTPRWTSMLALQRSRILDELFLETEPEWRLYEDLRAATIPFDLKPRDAALLDPEDPAGRTWFITRHGRARFAGADGFVFRPNEGSQCYLPRANMVVDALLRLESVASLTEVDL